MLLSQRAMELLVDSQREGLEFLERFDAKQVDRSLRLPEDLVFLDTKTVIGLHKMLGFPSALRSLPLLDSALNRARQAAAYANPTIHELAALTAEGIVRNHPFTDGNKRVAQLALCAFLTLNHEACPEDALQTGEIVLSLATREINVEDAGSYLSLCKKVYLNLDNGITPKM